jgi:hypothetical protein
MIAMLFIASVARTVPFVFSADGFTDIAIDNGSPVIEDYETPHCRFSDTGGRMMCRKSTQTLTLICL